MELHTAVVGRNLGQRPNTAIYAAFQRRSTQNFRTIKDIPHFFCPLSSPR